MGRPFTDAEKQVIRNRLIEVGKEEVGKHGAKKTSVEYIAKKVGISKGAFYSFFKSKEVFLFNVIEAIEDEIKESVTSIIPKERTNFREKLIDNIYKYIEVIRQPRYCRYYKSDDIAYICRGIPQSELKQHVTKDSNYIKKILMPAKDIIDIERIDLDFIISIIRVILCIICNEERIGEKSIDKVLRAQVEIIVDHLLESK